MEVNMTEKEYRSAPGLSGSELGTALQSWKHFRARREAPRVESDDMTLGSMIHAWVLEGEEVCRGRYPLAGTCDAEIGSGERKGQRCGASASILTDSQWLCGTHGKKAVNILPPGSVFVSAEMMARCESTSLAILANSTARALIDSSRHEVAFIGEHQGAPVKGRLDMIRSGHFIGDLKTTSRSIVDWEPSLDYLMQAGHYLRLPGEEGLFYLWIVAETVAPFSVDVVALQPQDAARIDVTVGRLWDEWAHVNATGIFPGLQWSGEPRPARIKPWLWEAIK